MKTKERKVTIKDLKNNNATERIKKEFQKNNENYFRKTLTINPKEKEKIPSIKMQINKKGKEKKTPKGKKIVNFTRKPNKTKTLKSERNALKGKKEDENKNELKLNKSVGNLQKDLNKSDISDSNKSLNLEKENLDKIEIKNDNIEGIKNYYNVKEPSNLKDCKKDEIIKNEDFTNQQLKKKEEDGNKIEVIELKSNFLQINNEEKNNENINNNYENEIEVNNIQIYTILNDQTPKKVTFNYKEQNKNANKPYSNFVEKIKNSNVNKKKKGNIKMASILKYEEPRSKISKALKKVNLMNKISTKNNEVINKNKQLRKTINNPMISNLREEILNTKKEAYDDFAKSTRNENKYNDLEKNYNLNIEKFSGFILLKVEEGEKLWEIKLEGEIKEINNFLNREKLEINNKEIELVDKNEFETVKNEKERIQNEFLKLKEEYDKIKEILDGYENSKKIKEVPIIMSKRKNIIDEENNELKEENFEIKEI